MDSSMFAKCAELASLSRALELAGALAAMRQLGYAKGFSDGSMLREFCDDYTPEPYWPMPDSRARADRLGWRVDNT